MSNEENDLVIYYAVGNANTQRQENEFAAIMRKRNSAGWKLISTSTACLLYTSPSPRDRQKSRMPSSA